MERALGVLRGGARSDIGSVRTHEAQADADVSVVQQGPG
jgi:hypothetical protein